MKYTIIVEVTEDEVKVGIPDDLPLQGLLALHATTQELLGADDDLD